MPVLVLVLKSIDSSELQRDLTRRFGRDSGFFDNDPVLVDLSPVVGSAQAPDFKALSALLKAFKLHPLGIRGGHPEHMAAAQQAGWLLADDVQVAQTPASSRTGVAAEIPVLQEVSAPTPVTPVDVTLPPNGKTLVIDRPLRSGQQVYARGRDLVMLAAVNPGAEVIADGHIHVYAPLRGRAIAGACGDHSARIFAQSMEAELIAIAGIYRTSETPLPPQVLAQPALVRLHVGEQGEQLLIDPIS